MDMLVLLMGLVIGLLAGFALAYLLLKGKGENQISVVNERNRLLELAQAELKNQLSQQHSDAQNQLKAERTKIEGLSSSLAKSEAEKDNFLQKLNEQKAELEQLNQRFTKEFENLANKILDEKSQKFTDQNKNNLDIILNPLKERIKEFEKRVEDTYKAENAERITLKTEIKNLIELNKQISEEANNLATALKGDNKQQGNWGELVLEKILERSGLKEGDEYKTQHTDQNASGDRIRPDVVIFLPDGKHVIVDSKVSAPGLHSPDFVLLFVPIESSFSLALQADVELFNFAWDRKIVIVSPSTLLATLRTIASIWKQERQTRNSLEIAEEGGKLYDKFVAFYEDLVKVGSKMDSAKADYVEAMKKLYEGSGNLVRRAEKMKTLGAKTTKQLPNALIERAEE